MSQPHVIITGGSGFIGSHLCERFLQDGYAVSVIDNLVTGSRKNVESFEFNEAFFFLEKDICEPIDPKEIPFLESHGLDGILHFACPASPVDFDKIPFEILKVDSVGTIRMVDLALTHQARFVLASTSEVYGDPLEHPQVETYFGNVSSVGPRACYDETKRFAEAYITSAARGTGRYQGMDGQTRENYEPLNGGMVRIFNTYGPRMRLDDGRVVPEFCRQAMDGSSLTVHGNGEQTRSFCFVSDLVEGISRYYKSEIKEPVNLGNPDERTIREFAELTIHLSESSSELIFTDARTDDPKQRCPDITRAQKHFNWSPSVSLESGLKETIDYFRKSCSR